MTKILRTIEVYILYATVFLFPLTVLPVSTNQFLVPRLTLLVCGVSLILLIKALRGLRGEKLEFTSGSFDLPLALLTITYVIPTFFVRSLNQMEAWLLPGTTTVIFTCVLFYFLTNQLEQKEKRILPCLLVGTSTISALINILAATGIFNLLAFFPAYMRNAAFSLDGSFPGTAVYLTALIPLVIHNLLKEKKVVFKTVLGVMLLVLTVNLIISVYKILPGQQFSPKFPNPGTSWAIAVEVIKTNPLLGVGPGNYLTAFNRFRPITFNQTNLWAVKFAAGHDFYLTLLTEVGVIGALTLIILFVKVYRLIATHPAPVSVNQHLLISRLPQMSVVVILISLAFFPGTVTLIWLLCLFLSYTSRRQVITLRFTSRLPDEAGGLATFLSSSSLLFVSSLLTIIIVPLFLYYSLRVVYAEYVFTRSLQAVANNDARLGYELMRSSLMLNHRTDRYHLGLSQLNLSLADGVAKKGNLSDQDRSTVTELIRQTIQEAKAAIALNPLRAGNWENLGRIYRAITPFARGANNFAIQSYQQAVALDPLNPNLRIALGGLFFATQKYDQAVRIFELAVLTKPDHPNTHYNLALAFKEKGDIGQAILQMKQVIALLQPNTADFDLAKSELDNLEKNRPGQNVPDSTNLTQPPALEEKLQPPIELGEENKPPEPAASNAPDISPSPPSTGNATPSSNRSP